MRPPEASEPPPPDGHPRPMHEQDASLAVPMSVSVQVPHPAGPGSYPIASPLSATPDVGSLLKALRRRWVLAVGTGLMGALAAGAAAWFLLPPALFTASAMLVVEAQQPKIIFA